VGLGLGPVPFGGAAEAAATATKIIDVGTREARIGLAVGEIFGGLIHDIGIGDVTEPLLNFLKALLSGLNFDSHRSLSRLLIL
jgi:hypothetical protein